LKSIHHQTIADPGRLRVSARSRDNCIECVEHPDYGFMVGLQWHPELRAFFRRSHQKLFNAFVQAARSRKKG
jgi:putative glutamine amidotransferase